MRLSLAALAALGSGTTLAKMQFIKPPAFTGKGEQSVLVVGSPLNLEWTPAQDGKRTSVLLYQLNATRAANFDGIIYHTENTFEYITQDQVGRTSYTWFVGTTSNLAISDKFVIGIWQESTDYADSTTDVFTIAKAAAAESKSSTGTASSSSASPTSSTPTGTSSSSITSPTTTTPTGTESATPLSSSSSSAANQSSSSSSSLSTGAAVGVGISATLAVILLLAAGWYLGRRWALARRGPRGTDVDPDGDLMAQSHGGGPVGVEYVQPGDKYYYGGGDGQGNGNGMRSELGVGHERVEAPGAWRGHELS